MSDYFQTLNRMEKEETRGTEGGSSAEAAMNQTREQQPSGNRFSGAYLEDKQPSFAVLFDNLRALANGRPVCSLVLAGASIFETIRSVSNGIVAQARRRGLTVLVAEVANSQAQPILQLLGDLTSELPEATQAACRSHAGDGGSVGNLPGTLSLDLRGGPVPAELERWLESARATWDLVIIEAPSLGRSLDAALVARACDGLVAVVEAEATPQDALQASVERAQAVGCRVLGLVVNGTRNYLPKWARRAAGRPSN